MIQQEKVINNIEIVPDVTLNLEQFLDDSFLEGEVVEERPIQLALHHSARGGAYKVDPANQTASQ
jgi:hypothetical protein